jgi:hypothetical protein
MNKKAQAAMEFLMTYGWAILVVLAAIGALVYFGVLSPDKFLPEKCSFPSSSGLGCVDWTATTPGSISVVVKNGAGHDLNGLTLEFIDTTNTDCQNPSAAINLTDGDQKTIVVACDDPADDRFASGKSFKSDVEISYTNLETNLSHVKKGEILLPLPN